MNKIPALFLSLLSVICFGQETVSFKGIVTDRNGIPIETASIAVFNLSDTLKYIFADTFSGGNFEIACTLEKGQKYGAYIYAMNYADKRIDIIDLKDTVIMEKIPSCFWMLS